MWQPDAEGATSVKPGVDAKCSNSGGAIFDETQERSSIRDGPARESGEASRADKQFSEGEMFAMPGSDRLKMVGQAHRIAGSGNRACRKGQRPVTWFDVEASSVSAD